MIGSSTAHPTLPDMVPMDLQMPDLNGIEATRRLTAASPHSGVLVHPSPYAKELSPWHD